MNDVTGFVLAGGGSTRMGQDKAFLDLHGQTLLTRALSIVASCREVGIVGDRARFGAFASTVKAKLVEDEFTGCGPLGGIHTALKGSTTDLNLILAVDLPFIPKELLEYLLACARAEVAVVTLPRTGGRWQPLCGIYRREFCKIAEQSLLRGQNKIDALFADISVRAIEDEELHRAGFSARMFRNLNTPEDWRQAQADKL